jgi:hypothetical protein
MSESSKRFSEKVRERHEPESFGRFNAVVKWRSLDSSLGYLGCPHPAEAGGVGRGAPRDGWGTRPTTRRVPSLPPSLQVVTLEEFREVYDGYIGGKYVRGVGGVRIPRLLHLRTGGPASNN